MPIIQNGKLVDKGFFTREDELQNAIARNPQILFTKAEPRVFLLKRKLYCRLSPSHFSNILKVEFTGFFYYPEST